MLWPKLNLKVADKLIGIKCEVRGSQVIDRNLNSNIILCSNHQSTWETFFIASCLKKQVCFIFKRELLFIPFFGWGIFLLDMIHINRRAGRNAIHTIINEAPNQFAQGRWLVFFPEGTRVSISEKKRYKIGAAVIASELGVPIIPIAHNAGKLWKKNAFIKRPGTIIVKFGDEIYPEGKRPDQIISLVKDRIEKLKSEIN
tara:strand:- start:183 stop:782 length:600 start_codon:yes stop_codon:yes gene_type:complete